MRKVTKKPKKKAIIKKTTNASLSKVQSKIAPLGSRVLIRPFTKEELEKKNNFGIILPTTGQNEKSEQGVVLAVGQGEYRDGKLVPVALRVGDKVAFSKYGYEEIKSGDEELYLIKEENILAVLK